MAFTIPTFNLTASIWRIAGNGKAYATPDVSTLCNLSPGRRSMLGQISVLSAVDEGVVMELLCPALTDIRADWNAIDRDLVEVPAGSHRFYLVIWVDDVAKGFPNEYRLAFLQYVRTGSASGFTGGHIAAPVPLP